jgi:tetratricopeptide (TPR) repeat protein
MLRKNTDLNLSVTIRDIRVNPCPLSAFLRSTTGWVLLMLLAALPARSQQPPSAESAVAEGVALLLAGKAAEARARFETAARLNPRLVTAHVYLGVAEAQLGSVARAIEHFREALALDPRSQAAHYNLALNLLRLGQSEEAIQELEQVVAVDPRFGPARYNLGLLLEQKGRFKEAADQLEGALAAQKTDSGALLHLVHCHFKAANAARALELAREGLARDLPLEAVGRLAFLLVENGFAADALPALERARAGGYASEELAWFLARAYLETGRPSQAVELLEPLRQSGSWRVLHALGLALAAAQRREAAIEALRQAVLLKPDEAPVRYSLGSLLLKADNGDDQRAGAEEIRRAIELAPAEAEHYIALGRWLLQQRQLDEVIGLLRRAVERLPASVDLSLMLALAEAQAHGAAVAIPLVEKAIALDSRVAPAWSLLGNCYFRVGDYERAVAHYKKAIELNPQNDLYLYDLALALERQNRVSEGVPLLERAIQLNPNRDISHYLLGKLYEKLDLRSEAIHELEASFRLDPESDSACYLLARVYGKFGDRARAEEWGRRFAQLKEVKDRRVGLAGPASEPPVALGLRNPWDLEAPAPRSPEQKQH